jgi:hypothetical protein
VQDAVSMKFLRDFLGDFLGVFGPFSGKFNFSRLQDMGHRVLVSWVRRAVSGYVNFLGLDSGH